MDMLRVGRSSHASLVENHGGLHFQEGIPSTKETLADVPGYAPAPVEGVREGVCALSLVCEDSDEADAAPPVCRLDAPIRFLRVKPSRHLIERLNVYPVRRLGVTGRYF